MVADLSGNAVAIDPTDGSQTLLIGERNQLRGVCIGPDRVAYVSEAGQTGNGLILRLSSPLEERTTTYQATDMAYDGASILYVAPQRGAVTRLNWATGFQQNIAFWGGAASGMALRSNSVFVTDLGQSALLKIEVTIETLSPPGMFIAPLDVDVDPLDMGALWVTEQANHTLVHFDQTTATAQVVSSAFNTPVGVAVEDSGSILVTDNVGQVIRVDRVAGEATVLSSGGYLSMPAGIAVVR